MKKRIVSMVLTLCMLLSMMPMMGIPASADQASNYCYSGETAVCVIPGQLGTDNVPGAIRNIGIPEAYADVAELVLYQNTIHIESKSVDIYVKCLKTGNFRVEYEIFEDSKWVQKNIPYTVYPAIMEGEAYTDTEFLAGCTFVGEEAEDWRENDVYRIWSSYEEVATVSYEQTDAGITLTITGLASGWTEIKAAKCVNECVETISFPVMVKAPEINPTEHTHEGWTAVNQTNVNAIFKSGYGRYYLTEDIVIDQKLSGDIFESRVICLNGHTLRDGSSLTYPMINMRASRKETTLTICSCQEGGKLIADNKSAIQFAYVNNPVGDELIPIPNALIVDSITIEGNCATGISSAANTTVIRNCTVKGFDCGINIDDRGLNNTTISDTTVTENHTGVEYYNSHAQVTFDGKCVIDGNYSETKDPETEEITKTVKNFTILNPMKDGSPNTGLGEGFDTVNSRIGVGIAESMSVPYTFCSSYSNCFYSDLDCYRVKDSSGATLVSRITQQPSPQNAWTIEVDTQNDLGDPVEVTSYTWKEVKEEAIEDCTVKIVDDYPQGDLEEGTYYIIGTSDEEGIHAIGQYRVALIYKPETSEPMQEKDMYFTVNPADEVKYNYGVTKLSDTEYTVPLKYNEYMYGGAYSCNLSSWQKSFTISDISIVSKILLSETSKQLKNAGDGEYTCTVTFKDGSSVTSEKASDSQKTAQTLDFASDSMIKAYGDADFTNTLSGANTTVTYESSEDSVASVDANGKVTIHKVGSTTIKATAAEDDTYASATASYTLTVNKAQDNQFTGKLKCADIAEGGTPSPTGLKAKYGKIEYLYSADDRKTWDTWEKVYIGVGTYYVKAYVTETENYNGCASSADRIAAFDVTAGVKMTISGDSSARHTDVKTYTVKFDGKRPCGTTVVWDIVGGTYEYVGDHIGTDSVTIICEDVGTLRIHATLVDCLGRPVKNVTGEIIEATTYVKVEAKAGNILRMIGTAVKTAAKAISRWFK